LLCVDIRLFEFDSSLINCYSFAEYAMGRINHEVT
jgi:hypothetical protein